MQEFFGMPLSSDKGIDAEFHDHLEQARAAAGDKAMVLSQSKAVNHPEYNTGMIISHPPVSSGSQAAYINKAFSVSNYEVLKKQNILSLKLGSTLVTQQELMQHLKKDLAKRYTEDSYDVLKHNCNSFTDEVSTFLTGHGIPECISKLPERAMNSMAFQVLRPILNHWLGGFDDGGADSSQAVSKEDKETSFDNGDAIRRRASLEKKLASEKATETDLDKVCDKILKKSLQFHDGTTEKDIEDIGTYITIDLAKLNSIVPAPEAGSDSPNAGRLPSKQRATFVDERIVAHIQKVYKLDSGPGAKADHTSDENILLDLRWFDPLTGFVDKKRLPKRMVKEVLGMGPAEPTTSVGTTMGMSMAVSQQKGRLTLAAMVAMDDHKHMDFEHEHMKTYVSQVKKQAMGDKPINYAL